MRRVVEARLRKGKCFQELWVGNKLVVSAWGMVSKVSSNFVCISGTDVFFHTDKIIWIDEGDGKDTTNQ